MSADFIDRVEQRLADLNLSARAACMRAGLNADAIRDIKRSAASRDREYLGPRRRTVAALARALNTTPEWLLTGEDVEPAVGGAAGASLLPYVDWHAAPSYLDQARSLESADRLGEPAWPQGTFVTRAPDDAMNRLAPAGAYVIVDRTDRLVSTGLMYLGVLDGQPVLRRWFPNPERAEPFSTDPAYRTEFLGPDRSWSIIGRVRRILFDV